MTDEVTTSEAEATGRSIGRYRLAYEIASGGQASIFMAVADGPQGFGKVVALKRLHKHLAKDASFVSMFLDEARLAAQLTHPNVCGVIDFGVEDGDHFMAMEYLTGVTVAKLASHAQRLAAQGKLDRKHWASIVAFVLAGAAEGLRAAHELKDVRGEKLNVVHRDVSPQNLMVGFDGSVRVMDFGIAKYDERDTETALGEVKGKYAYMSPEQARAGKVDHRTDIWALGVIAWELLTLRRLFKRETTAHTVLAVMNDDIDAPSRVEPSVSAEVDAVILAALSRDPEARIDDARTFGNALRRAIHPMIDASDLAAWVQESFPAAEAEARTMIDLARQSAKGVPSIARREKENSSSSSSMSAPMHAVLRSDGEPLELSIDVGHMHRRPERRWLFGAIGALVMLGAMTALYVGVLSPPADPPSAPSAPPRLAERPPAAPSTSPTEALPAEPPPEPPAAPPSEDLVATLEVPTVVREAQQRRVVRPREDPARQPQATAVPTPGPTPGPSPAPTPPPVAPPDPPPATPASASTGTLVVVTPGTWANVYGPSGDLWGATPLRRTVPAGSVAVELRFEGQPPGRRVSVDVPGAGTGRISERP